MRRGDRGEWLDIDHHTLYVTPPSNKLSFNDPVLIARRVPELDDLEAYRLQQCRPLRLGSLSTTAEEEHGDVHV